MTGVSAGPWAARAVRAALGPDRPADMLMVAATFVAYLVIDRVTRMMAVVEPADLGRPSLVAAAIGRRWWLVAGLTLGAVGLAARWPERLLRRWDELDGGRPLRLLAGGLAVLVAWQAALYPYNWLAGRSHWLDRIIVVVLLVGVLARPVFLVPFVAVSRIVIEQFVLPLDTAAARNIDDLLAMVLLAVAAGHLAQVLSGRRDTSPVLLVAVAALAAHFFVPGRGKLVIGWLGAGRIADLALGSYTAGWLAHTGGGWARWLWAFYDRFHLPIMAATLAIELGAIVAVTRPRLVRWWLPGCLAFHAVTFVTTGFWFARWIALELGLLAIFALPSTRAWVDRNATPARGALAALAVLVAPLLFHPPGLAWIDAPVSHGYRIEAVDAAGRRVNLAAADLAPLDHHVAFAQLDLGPHPHAVGAYGAAGTADTVDALSSVTSFEELTAYEAGLGGAPDARPTIDFLTAFLEHAAQEDRPMIERFGRWLGPPSHFWTSAPEPRYRPEDPDRLRRLEVFALHSIHRNGLPLVERQLVLSLEVGDDGVARVVDTGGP